MPPITSPAIAPVGACFVLPSFEGENEDDCDEPAFSAVDDGLPGVFTTANEVNDGAGEGVETDIPAFAEADDENEDRPPPPPPTAADVFGVPVGEAPDDDADSETETASLLVGEGAGCGLVTPGGVVGLGTLTEGGVVGGDGEDGGEVGESPASALDSSIKA